MYPARPSGHGYTTVILFAKIFDALLPGHHALPLRHYVFTMTESSYVSILSKDYTKLRRAYPCHPFAFGSKHTLLAPHAVPATSRVILSYAGHRTDMLPEIQLPADTADASRAATAASREALSNFTHLFFLSSNKLHSVTMVVIRGTPNSALFRCLSQFS